MHFVKVETLSIRVNKKSFASSMQTYQSLHYLCTSNLSMSIAIADGILHPVTDDIKEALLSDPDVFLIVTKFHYCREKENTHFCKIPLIHLE
jgi:hypothetical protein